MSTVNGGERTIGVHGLEILRVLFLLGSATSSDLAGILGLETGTVGRQLNTLLESGFVERMRCLPVWETSTGGSLPFLYSLKQRGVYMSGDLVGIEDRDSLRAAYGSCQPVSRYSHRLMQTRYVRYLTEATRGSIFKVEYSAGEHAEGFPLELWQGQNVPVSRIALPGKLRRTIRPDGLVRVRAGGSRSIEDTSLDIIFELETGSRNLKDVLAKVIAYLSYLEIRCATNQALPLPDDPGGLRYRVCPQGHWPAVLFLSPTESGAARMRRYVVRELEEHDKYQLWVWRMRQQYDLDPAWFFLFGSLEACAERSADPLEKLYLPLEPHANAGGDREDPGRFSLLDVMAISDGFFS